MFHNGVMEKPQSKNDRHKPRKMVGIRARLAARAAILANRLDHDLTQIVNDALREKLEREGLWPPADEADLE
ncbi:hypothetical protein [Tuwongella immobilis]|uniref:hypothetical protein n=1 Tax=Tuwongella immobilis TaxID=692036 RepID=UPI0013A6F5CB|nr:hypothetical protein [Tuwongella immobilis]